MPHSRGPNFSVSRLKIHVFGHKLDTLCSTRAETILAFRELKSVFKAKNCTLSATRADPIFPFHYLKSMFLVKNKTLYPPLAA